MPTKKPGLQTSELWLSVVGLFAVMQTASVDEHYIVRAAAVVAVGAVLCLYMASRTKSKNGG